MALEQAQSVEVTAIPEIEEIAIGIAGKSLNHTMLSIDFLKASGIIPSDWELAKQPVMNPRGAQLSFKNGVNIAAQPGAINFIEGIGKKTPEELQLANLAAKYVEKLPNAEYQALNISPKTLVPLSGEEDAARKFITEKLLAPGPWLEFGKEPVQAAINLFYQLDECQLSLSLNPARVQQPNKPSTPALLFSGTFNYNLTNYTGEDKLAQLNQLISGWQNNLAKFRELVNQRFMQRGVGEQESLFPM